MIGKRMIVLVAMMCFGLSFQAHAKAEAGNEVAIEDAVKVDKVKADKVDKVKADKVDKIDKVKKESDKAAKDAAKSTKKACIDAIMVKMSPLKTEKDASCGTEEQEATPACIALKEQISALKSQLKACK